jgi:hypothetical protein
MDIFRYTFMIFGFVFQDSVCVDTFRDCQFGQLNGRCTRMFFFILSFPSHKTQLSNIQCVKYLIPLKGLSRENFRPGFPITRTCQ